MDNDNDQSDGVVSTTDGVFQLKDGPNDQDASQQTEHHVDDGDSIIDPDSLLETSFKKPVPIIGPRRGKSAMIRPIADVNSGETSNPSTSFADSTNQIDCTAEVSKPEKIDPNPGQKEQLLLPYKEPSWAGIPEYKYKFEVLKSGVILDAIELNEKSFYVIGRLPVCDIPLAHPTISRYHAILQYRNVGDDKNGPGFYIYDLESTHGTFWNGSRIRPKHYVKLHGGHMIRFGCSQRKFIFQSPSDEVEAESEYTVTELKEMRRLELLKREEDEKERLHQEEELKKAKEEREQSEGIDWGMGEDADEESDMTENPYALTTNEELFLDDPKKTLRGWFEREGHDMQYQTEEKGIGQFLCWIELPIDNATGRPIRAEALVKGKKKESVIQCALEACRILDRQGLLRQATHEGKKRKLRNWEEEDYYDSDEDNFLDRTGTIERKREQRMRNAGKLETRAETFTSLVEKHSVVVMKITKILNTLENHEKARNAMNDNPNEDALDAFMSNLSSALLNKADTTKMKLELQHLRKEEEGLKKLMNIAKPANLPSLNLSKPTELRIESNEISVPNKISRPDNKRQRVENTKSEQRLVPNKGQYGLMKKEEAISVENEKLGDGSMDHDEEIDENSDAILDTDNEKNNIENLETDKNINLNDNETLKRRKRNMRRTQQRAGKVAKEVEKAHDENLFREDYSMWVPPENQSGDGKTSLNDKLGY